MNISEIRTYVVRHKLSEPFGFSQWWYDTREILLVEVVTDRGISGWGEAYGPARVIRAAVSEFFAPLFAGAPAGNPEALWDAMYGRSCDYGRKGIMLSAISAIDVALWDIRGKAAGKPIYRLLREDKTRVERIPAYASGMYFLERDDLAGAMAEEAAGYAAQGFRGVKMKVGLTFEQDLRNLDAVRAAVGDGICLMADANHAYDREDAARMADALAERGVMWFEEPLSPDDLEGYRQLRDASKLLIAGGECEFTRHGFEPFIRGCCADIIQPDPCAAGGISEMRHVVALAEECGARVVFHTWGSAVAVAVALHLNAGLFAGRDAGDCPFPWPWIELDRTENPFREDMLREPIRLADGELTVPQGPGLGIEPDMDFIREHQIA
jgi:D-galactarolactone cycloisomerase